MTGLFPTGKPNRLIPGFVGYLRRCLNWFRPARLPVGPAKQRVQTTPRQPLGMEPLEPRTTISDVLLGAMLPGLLQAKAVFSPSITVQSVGLFTVLATDPGQPEQTPQFRLPDRGLSSLPAQRSLAAAVPSPSKSPTENAQYGFASWGPGGGNDWSAEGRAGVSPHQLLANVTRSVAEIRAIPEQGGLPTLPRDHAGREASPTADPIPVQPFASMTAKALEVIAGLQQGPPLVASSGFVPSYQSGYYDDSGAFVGGTELMHLVAHKGMLFAGTSSWMDVPVGQPRVGSQILRLDEPYGTWQLDLHFDEFLEGRGARNLRMEMLKSVTFTTDEYGNLLDEPVSVLLASPTDLLGLLAVYSRNDEDGTWTQTVLAELDEGVRIRSLGLYQDTVTGVDRVFAGSTAGIFSGVYDPKVPGLVRWDMVPELLPTARPMAFAVAEGALHVVIKPAMYRRLDGPEPSWEQVLTYPEPPPSSEGLRGLTTTPGPFLPGEVMLAGVESLDTYIARSNPRLGYRPTLELDVRAFLIGHFGSLAFDFIIPAYNDMLPVIDPRTEELVHLIGIMCFPPAGPQARSAFYLIRHANLSYELREIPSLPNPYNPTPTLRAVRSMVISPFPEDEGQAVYFAGYDANSLPTHNSAWVYRSSLEYALDGPG